ncbi:MAG: hypothetical protein AMXMBFR44_4770 [Candidatus Campbellbacteria bacterium]
MHSRPHRFREYVRSTFASLSFLERAGLVVLAAIAVVSLSWMLLLWHGKLTVVVPAPGGTLHEGIVGTPRFINPLLAQTDADRDLTILMYAGLMRALPGGELIPDLAESYSVSDDKTVYTFTLRPELYFHDNTPLTARDVVFTVKSAQDPRIGSLRAGTWDGVTVEAQGARTVVFTLSRPYAGFLNNTTLGIMPQHIWEDIAAEDFRGSTFNERPVGSGPFALERIRENDGVVTNYLLRPFKRYGLGEPYLSRIFLHIFGNEREMLDAYADGDIDAFRGTDPYSMQQFIEDAEAVKRYPLPRTFGVFFNYNHNDIFTDQAVRKALSYAVNRDEIIENVLGGFGTPITTPLPPHLYSATATPAKTVDDARALLENSGWTRDAETGVYTKKSMELSFSIKTVNSPALKLAAELLQKQWNDLGASVSVELFDLAALNQSVIRTRDYDALLFGQVLSREGDLYPFWHSSQRNDPGLNVALYTNASADATLEKLRTTLSHDERTALYGSFLDEWQSDIPSLFLYVPDMVYVLPKNILGVYEGSVQEPSERFLDAHTWYVNTQRIFTFLVN